MLLVRSSARVFASIALVEITKVATGANLAIRIKIDHFATGKHNQITNTAAKAAEEIVVKLHGRQVILEGPVSRHDTHERIVIDSKLLYTAIAHFGVGRRNAPAKSIVVHVKVAHANQCPGTHTPIVWQRTRELVATQIEVIQKAEIQATWDSSRKLILVERQNACNAKQKMNNDP